MEGSSPTLPVNEPWVSCEWKWWPALKSFLNVLSTRRQKCGGRGVLFHEGWVGNKLRGQ